MKTLILVTFLSVPLFCTAQIKPDSVPNAQKEVYCIIDAYRKTFSSKYTLTIDYGQERSIFQRDKLRDVAGKVKNFSSPVDALNYMAQQGWVLVTSHHSDSSGITEFVLKKEL